MNSKRQQSSENTDPRTYHGISLSECSPQNIANKFSQHFSSVFSPTQPTSTLTHTSATQKPSLSQTKIDLRLIQCSDVASVIKRLKPKRSMGPDRVPPYVYKGCAEFLLQPLTHIFNLSISSSVFPSIWKTTKVVPIPKVCNTIEIADHRPVALLSVPAKIFESILHEQIYTQINHLIADEQHGFHKSRSVQTNLASFTHTLTMLIYRLMSYTQISRKHLTKSVI